MSNIKLVVFDMDGTLLQPRSSWAQIHDHFGTDNTEMLQLYIDHKITDEEFVKADIKLWNSNSKKTVNEEYINSIMDKIKPLKGAEILIKELHNKNIKTVILSGGIQYLADRWMNKWNMDYALANELIDDDKGNLTAIINSSGHNKGPMMDKIIKKYNYKKNQVAAVGDTIVDIPMFDRAGLAIAVNTDDKKVIEKADYHLKGDLRELKNLIIKW
ncbi:MAG: HAD-IB family phosphatase [Candidatus Poseidoniia archaeon]|nr:HAD-IB family phosphatase [Candidatus Poseidoniia archaeon]